MADRDALLCLFEMTGGEQWRNLNGWREALRTEMKPGTHFCSSISRWHGVQVDTAGRAHVVYLRENGLSGSLNMNMMCLACNETVRNHYVEKSREQTVPTAALREREVLRQSLVRENRRYVLDEASREHNCRTCVRRMAALTNLRTLDLSSNSLTHRFPQWISSLRSLAELVLSWNSFEGELPESVFSLTTLRVLRLDHNHFEGTISSSIGCLTDLRFLDLSFNKFTG